MVTRWLLQLKTKSSPRGKEEVGTETKTLPAYYKALLEYYPATSMSHYLNLGQKSPFDQSLKGSKMGREKGKEKREGISVQSTKNWLSHLPS